MNHNWHSAQLVHHIATGANYSWYNMVDDAGQQNSTLM